LNFFFFSLIETVDFQLKNNDPRMRNCILHVHVIQSAKVIVQNFLLRINSERMFNNNKKKKFVQVFNVWNISDEN
jgi:hypothetical protein